MFSFGKSTGEVNLGKSRNPPEVSEKENLEGLID